MLTFDADVAPVQAIDPRIAYRPKTQMYYLTWDNCTKNCVLRQTMLSVTKTPFNHSSWQFMGQVLKGAYAQPLTSGASLLFRDDADADGNNLNPPGADETALLNPGVERNAPPPHLAFVANSNTANGILLAESADGLNWTLPANASRRMFMSGRPDCWDHGES